MTFSVAGNPVAFRPMRESDRGYIYMTWMRSLQAMTDMPPARFVAWQKPIVEWAIDYCDIMVACDPAAPDSIFGWTAQFQGHAGHVLAYTYVMNSLRHHGLASELRKQ